MTPEIGNRCRCIVYGIHCCHEVWPCHWGVKAQDGRADGWTALSEQDSHPQRQSPVRPVLLSPVYPQYPLHHCKESLEAHERRTPGCVAQLTTPWIHSIWCDVTSVRDDDGVGVQFWELHEHAQNFVACCSIRYPRAHVVQLPAYAKASESKLEVRDVFTWRRALCHCARIDIGEGVHFEKLLFRQHPQDSVREGSHECFESQVPRRTGDRPRMKKNILGPQKRWTNLSFGASTSAWLIVASSSAMLSGVGRVPSGTCSLGDV